MLSLLVPLLLIDVMPPRTLGAFEGNQTHNLLNGTVEPTNATLERKLLEAELNNQTSHNVAEDDERFQDPEGGRSMTNCDRKVLQQVIDLCGPSFHTNMLYVDRENRCNWENIVWPYYLLTECLIENSGFLNCFYPNPHMQDFFLHVHTLYFHNCSREEAELEEPPEGLVVTLILIPIGFMLVYLLAWTPQLDSSCTDLHS